WNCRPPRSAARGWTSWRAGWWASRTPSWPARRTCAASKPDGAGRIRPPRRVFPPAMPLFWKPYKSDVTQFIDQLKASKPTLEDEQRAGRALWWDRRVDAEALAEYRQSRVPQQAYVYQTKV